MVVAEMVRHNPLKTSSQRQTNRRDSQRLIVWHDQSRCVENVSGHLLHTDSGEDLVIKYICRV